MAQPSGYNLVWSDEFPGNTVDTNKWLVTFDGNKDNTYTTYSPNAEFWPSTNMAVVNGNLQLKVSKVGNIYRTAALTSVQRWTHGYFEAAIRTPVSSECAGIGCNFWSDAQNWQFPEIDIFEWSGSEENQYRANFHDGNSWLTAGPVAGFNPDVGQRVALEWTATKLRWFLNEVLKKEFTIPAGWTPVPQQLLIGATVGPFGHLIDPSTVLPATYFVNYVRVYQK